MAGKNPTIELGRLLDTNTLSYVFRKTAGYEALFERIRAADPNRLFVSVVSVEEIMQGAFATIRKEQATGGTSGYARLKRLLGFLSTYNIVDYDDTAEALFRALPVSVRRNGRGDCQIAMTAVTGGLTVVTHNIAHFEAIAQSVPALRYEDWS